MHARITPAARSIGLLVAAVALHGCRPPAPAAFELRITASEYAFQMPDTIPAGLVHITVRNSGRDIHEAALERFTDTLGTAAAFVDSIRAHVDFPANVEDVGGAALTLPGDSNGVWLVLPAGRYAVACWKGDHLTRGMAHDLVVVPSRDPPAPPPRATRELTLVDYAYFFDSALVAGRTILHVHNAGREAHEGDLFRATPTTGLREYMAWLDGDQTGLPPVAPVAAFGDLFPGKEAWIAIDLPPGRYFMLCGVPGREDGHPHYKRGMFTEFTIQPPGAPAAP